MKVSVIIAVKADNPNLRQCLDKLFKLYYEDFEILVLPDEPIDFSHDLVRIIPTGKCLPAEKRDLAAEQANGEILAFIDDDAYPSEDWLTAAVKNFSSPEVAAVGGPAVTPPTEDFPRLAGGLVYESFFVSGTFRYRYKKSSKRFVDDYPSCNLLVKKDIFLQAGGFKTNFWPGEDTILCLEITKRLRKKIVYDPDVLVFHHRRPLFLPHLKQIANYGLHRGYFVKRFPETSLKWQYFLPSLFFTWLSSGFVISFFNVSFFHLYLLSIILYFSCLAGSCFKEKDIKMCNMVIPGIFFTHVCYGIFFLTGLFTKKLNEEKLI